MGARLLDNRDEVIAKQALKAAGFLADAYNIQRIKAGMTNNMYLFMKNGEKYLIRIPGEGTEYLVNRKQEVEVYELLKGRGITEETLYMNGDNGIKVTKFLEDAHVCSIDNWKEVAICIKHLRQFHELGLQVGHEFNIYKKIEDYEKRCKKEVGRIKDYEEVKAKIMSLKDLTDQGENQYVLCHIDPVTDNFLIDSKKIYLIDWEYAAMCNPLIDIAMFCIYSNLNKDKTDLIINIYFDGNPREEDRKKVYAYMAASAFLWVLWSEIKNISGENYEEYKNIQYEIAKRFYEYAIE